MTDDPRRLRDKVVMLETRVSCRRCFGFSASASKAWRAILWWSSHGGEAWRSTRFGMSGGGGGAWRTNLFGNKLNKSYLKHLINLPGDKISHFRCMQHSRNTCESWEKVSSFTAENKYVVITWRHPWRHWNTIRNLSWSLALKELRFKLNIFNFFKFLRTRIFHILVKLKICETHLGGSTLRSCCDNNHGSDYEQQSFNKIHASRFSIKLVNEWESYDEHWVNLFSFYS